MTEAAPKFTKGRDLDATAVTLREWLAPHLGAGVEVGGFDYPSGAGVSNETILFDATVAGTTHELVLRAAPRPEYQLFVEPGFRLQYDLLVALRELDLVPVPEVLWFEDDPAVLGSPFFLMRRMRGRVPVSMPVYNATGWLTEATSAERRTLWHSAMEAFTAIHAVPVDALDFVDRPQLEWWWGQALWAFDGDVPDEVATLFEWLRANDPHEPAGLSWGDARMGNMMFGDDFRVVGVMDWEQANLGGGLSDLGWWLFFDDMHSVEQGITRLDGLGTRQETIDLWEERTGQATTNLPWHEAFAGVKTSLLASRTKRVMNLGSLGGNQPDPYLPKVHRILGWA